MDIIKDYQKIAKLARAVNNLNVVMAEASSIQSKPEFYMMPKRCRGTLVLQILYAQKLLNDYKVIQNQDDLYVEIPYNYRQYLLSLKRQNKVLILHTQKIHLCLEHFSAIAS